jgi:hypothetical protein
MCKTLRILTFLAIACALPLLAQTPMTITPSSGPVTGGTVVTITGNFTWPGYGVIFGDEWASQTERIDNHTLRTIAPPHAAGTVKITIFEYDIGYETDLTFTYGGVETDAYESVLLPMFTPPVFGKFGSEFHTALSISAEAFPGKVTLYGLQANCEVNCAKSSLTDGDPQFEVEGGTDVQPRAFAYNGTPGRFFRIAKDDLPRIGAHLWVQDLTRSSLNYGTEIPIVRRSEFRKNHLLFAGVPFTPAFRNTLRIYGDQPFWAVVRVGDREPVRVRVDGANGAYVPAYGVFTDFPTEVALTRVTIDAESDLQTLVPVDIPFWAFITVTGNESQIITTITPQP